MQGHHVWGMGDASILLSQRTGGGGAAALGTTRERACLPAGLMIANLLEGMEHEEAARLAGLSRSAAYEWHNRYEEDGIEGLRDRPAHIAVRHHREPCSRQSRDSAPRDTLLGQAPNPRRRWVRSWRGSLPLRTRIKRLCLSPAAEVELGEDVPGHAHPFFRQPAEIRALIGDSAIEGRLRRRRGACRMVLPPLPLRSPAGFAAATAPRSIAPPPGRPRPAGGVQASVWVRRTCARRLSSGRSPPRELDFIALLCYFINQCVCFSQP